MIRVVIADDHPLVRDGIVAILTREPDLEVLAQAGSGPEAVAMVAHHDPDVVLMDLRMPGGDGVDAIRTLRGQRSDRPRILVLTTYDTDRDIRAALAAGADGYLLKTVESDQLADTIVKVLEGESVISPEMMTKLVSVFRTRPAAPAAEPVVTAVVAPEPSREAQVAVGLLSPREREILLLIARGDSNKHIARELDIAETTVKIHVQHILRKLGLSSRVQAAVYLAGRSG